MAATTRPIGVMSGRGALDAPATLTLDVQGLRSRQREADDGMRGVAASCPALEELTWYWTANVDGDIEKGCWSVNVDVLRALKAGCPRLRVLPRMSMKDHDIPGA